MGNPSFHIETLQHLPVERKSFGPKALIPPGVTNAGETPAMGSGGSVAVADQAAWQFCYGLCVVCGVFLRFSDDQNISSKKIMYTVHLCV